MAFILPQDVRCTPLNGRGISSYLPPLGCRTLLYLLGGFIAGPPQRYEEYLGLEEDRVGDPTFLL
nr:MAG TPA: hypothetical protein [Bacteriophage sp.]